MKTATKSAAKKPAAGGRAKKAAVARLAPSGRFMPAKTDAATRQASQRTAYVQPFRFEQVFLSPPSERINTIKRGVPAEHVNMLAERMDIAKETLIDTLGLARATVNRKARANMPLSQDESERVLGIEYLIGQVENMIKESGDPEGFDAAKWVSNWLNSPLPALGGQTPASYMDTVEGQKLVSNLLATAQSGAYA